MGVLNLAHCRRDGQEQIRQCKLATTYLATSIVQLTRFSVPLHLRPLLRKRAKHVEKQFARRGAGIHAFGQRS